MFVNHKCSTIKKFPFILDCLSYINHILKLVAEALMQPFAEHKELRRIKEKSQIKVTETFQ
jgi:hypothetical protein